MGSELIVIPEFLNSPNSDDSVYNSPDSGESSGLVNNWALVNGGDSTDFTRGHFRGFLTPVGFNFLVTNWCSAYFVVPALRDFSPCCTTVTKLYLVKF